MKDKQFLIRYFRNGVECMRHTFNTITQAKKGIQLWTLDPDDRRVRMALGGVAVDEIRINLVPKLPPAEHEE